MVKNWTKNEIILTILSFILTVLITRLVVQLASLLTPYDARGALAALFIVPMLCAAITAFFLKNWAKRFRYSAIILSVFDILLIVLSQNIVFAAKLMQGFTGHYNLEATGFLLLFIILFCSGMLAGLGLGCLIWWYRNRAKS